MFFFEKIAEQRIQEAMAEGLFDNLAGKGQPLKLEDDSHIPPELRIAYKILKMADCLPPELELQKEIITLRDLLADLPDEKDRLQQMRRLNFLTMKLSLVRKISPLMQEHNIYTEKILNKLAKPLRTAASP